MVGPQRRREGVAHDGGAYVARPPSRGWSRLRDARCTDAHDHRLGAPESALRYTPPALVRQNPRTTRPVVALARSTGRSTTRRSPDPTVFDTLSDRLRTTLGTLTGRGRISEADVDAAMREVRLALLEADVNFKVVKDFVARVREQAIGQDILASLTAGQAVVKIVHDELVELLSKGDRVFHLSGQPRGRRDGRSAGLGQDHDRRPSSPATSSSRVAGRCSSRRTRTVRPPRTSSRRSASSSTSPCTGHRRGRRSRRSPGRASRRPSARRATS